MHPEARGFVRTALLRHTPRVVLEVGSRDINGGVRDLFVGAESYVGIDVVDGPGVDLVADGATYWPDQRPDTVVCCEVLEHAPEAEAIVRHLVEVVSPGGLVIFTCAGPLRTPHSAVDGGPLRAGEFYRNLAAADLRAWLASTSMSRVSEAGGDIQAWAIR